MTRPVAFALLLLSCLTARAGDIVSVYIDGTARAAQRDVPVTFGQVFAAGDLPAGAILQARVAGRQQALPLQVDVKAAHPDRSVRHAVLTVLVPELAPRQPLEIVLATGGAHGAAPGGGSATRASAHGAAPAAPAALLAAGLSGRLALTADGKVYTASLEQALRGRAQPWLAGPLAAEWIAAAPLRAQDGRAHPHLMAYFHVRGHAGARRARIDVVVENDWAFEPGPRNIVYDAELELAGKSVWRAQGLKHFHHARWKKSFWWGDAPGVHVRHDTAYLIASRAVPNYDRRVRPHPQALAALRERMGGPAFEPMGAGLATAYMPTTGGRPDLGLLPGWAVSYLLSMDADAKAATLRMGDLAGGWPMHYRDKRTGRVVSIVDYPYMTRLGRTGDTMNPKTKKSEAFPACAGDCETALSPDSSHQPNFSYLPYLVTGDYYHLEELQFWAMFNLLQHNPGYRDAARGLVKPDQVRGQAWSLRTLAEAAWITPDADPLKRQFLVFLDNNLDWYNARYTRGAADAALGAVVAGEALVYDNGIGIAPWQDDFFTMAVGRAAELGFAKAQPLLAWKARFPVLRMVGEGACWVDAAMYKMKVRDTPKSPIYTGIGQAFRASQPPELRDMECGSPKMAYAMKLRSGEMSGAAHAVDGYPAYLQPALAYSVDAGHPHALRAWRLFEQRGVKPDYSRGPQFAIVPRTPVDAGGAGR